jgi:hypothetical protein
MFKFMMAALAAMSLAEPVLAEGIKGWKTYDSQGCMILRECTEDTWRVFETEDIEQRITYANYNGVREEADALLTELEKMGVEVYLADDRYFVRGVAGTYHAGENNFFLNVSYVDDPIQFLRTLRHEAWHAAQDAMAGTIDNTMLAVIEDDTKIPQNIKLMVEISYPPSARPWEQEAKWAGETPGMTLAVLKTINESGGRPWEVLEPTPLTRLWLERNGYL